MIDLNAILEIGIALSAESNQNKLLNTILIKAMEATNSDGGTLYTLEKDKLVFRIIKTITLNIEGGFNGEKINIPPVPLDESFVASYCAIHQETINIPDVYKSNLFDFSGPMKYDKLNNYRTKSMLVHPLVDNKGNTLGVLQLLNSTEKDGTVSAYPKAVEQIVSLLASFSNIALSNMNYQLEIKKQMFSFFDVIITAIDERTPYNATHTVRIVEILLSFFDYINSSQQAIEICGKMTRERKEVLIMSAWLHDIGKLVTPLDVLNKSTRLAEKEEQIINRMELIELLAKLNFLESTISKEEYEHIKKETYETIEYCKMINVANFVSPEDKIKINSIAEKTYIDKKGNAQNWLTPDEVKDLSIKSGTLTDDERKIIQNHAAVTTKLVNKMLFSEKYKNVQKWAGAHHELLNGKGYPLGLSAKQIPTEVRILTILDIFEALTTSDRPYKNPMPATEAFVILNKIANFGEIDLDILKIFELSKAWETPKKMKEYLEQELTMF